MDCITTVTDILVKHLDQDSDNIFIQRAHRFGKHVDRHKSVIGQAINKKKHSYLIALFRNYPDVDIILGASKKLQGTTFGINRHFSPEIIAARMPLFEEKKKLLNTHPCTNVSIPVPAKLILDGRLFKDALSGWHEKSRLTTVTLPGPVPALHRRAGRVRLFDKRMNEPVGSEHQVFEDNLEFKSETMGHSDAEIGCRSPAVTTVDIQTPDPHLDHSSRPPSLVLANRDFMGEVIGWTTTATIEPDSDYISTPQYPPPSPHATTDSISSRHD